MIFNKTITIYFQNKNKWQIAPDLHKKSEKCDTSRNYENVFFLLQKPKEREVGERGGEQEQQRERREQKSKAGPDDDDDDDDEWGWGW